jgi:Glycosyl hydrolase family 99
VKKPHKLISLGMFVCLFASLFSFTQVNTAQAQTGERTPGMVAAFYYPWYDPRDPDTWNPNKMASLPATKYSSGDINYVRGQMTQARDAGIDSFAVTWNDPQGDWANRFRAMLDNAPSGFTISAHYEVTLARDTSANTTISNLRYIRDTLATNPKYMRLHGKPVIFFWRPQAVDGAGNNVSGVWQNIRNQVDPNREMLWSADGVDTNLLQVFDGIHFFSAAKEQNDPTNTYRNFRARVDQAQNQFGGYRMWVAGVTPGYDDRKFRSPGEFRDRAGGNYYQTSWRAAIASNPDLITISTWNEWFESSAIEPGEVWGNQYVDLTRQFATQYKGTTTGFGDASISKVWNRTDLQVASGAVKRSWLWGPELLDVVRERYAEGPNGHRFVYYFDKARMEITRVNNNFEDRFFVTNGLLVREMMRGKIQYGDSAEEDKGAANIPVAGDTSNNPSSPTFASMAKNASLADDKKLPNRTGQTVTETVDAGGNIGNDAGYARYGVTYAYYEPTLSHNIARPFWDFFNQTGPIVVNGTGTTGQVIDWLTAMGYPITDAYWAKIKVGGQDREVLVQAFERRVMTYDPNNPEGFKVEMGNVGLQYYKWRYNK